MNSVLPIFQINLPNALHAKAVSTSSVNKVKVEPERSTIECVLERLLVSGLVTQLVLLAGALFFAPSLAMLGVFVVFLAGSGVILGSFKMPVVCYLSLNQNRCVQYLPDAFDVIIRPLPVETPPPR